MRWCKHYLEDAHARHCAHATAVTVAPSACPTTNPWTRESGNEVWRGGGLPPLSPVVASGCAQMCSPPASTSTPGYAAHLAHAEGVLYGTELGLVTLKRVGLFCFPIKQSTHTHGTAVSRLHTRLWGGMGLWGWGGEFIRNESFRCDTIGLLDIPADMRLRTCDPRD